MLDLSKVLMYEFYYDYIKDKYGNNINDKDIYEDFTKDKELRDFSNYSSGPIYYDDSKKLVVSRMKDETVSVTVKLFVGLNPKIYSFLVGDSTRHKKSKGYE